MKYFIGLCLAGFWLSWVSIIPAALFFGTNGMIACLCGAIITGLPLMGDK